METYKITLTLDHLLNTTDPSQIEDLAEVLMAVCELLGFEAVAVIKDKSKSNG